MKASLYLLASLALIIAAPVDAFASGPGMHEAVKEAGASGPMLSWLIVLPLIGVFAAIAARVFGIRKADNLRWLMLAIMGAELALATSVYRAFDPALARIDDKGGYQLVERFVLSRSLGAEYFVGVDGISVAMVLLTALLAFVGVLASWPLRRRMKTYWAMYCLAVSGMVGVFVALDLLLFFAFWLLALAPLALLVALFGETKTRRAALKLTSLHLGCTVSLLFAIIALYLHSDPMPLSDGSIAPHGFGIPDLARIDHAGRGTLLFGLSFVKLVFIALFLAFAGLLLPFHGLLIDALVEAPTAISLLLAGVMLKLGGYGLLRISFGILPEASAWSAPTVAVLGVATLLYGAARAMAQSDLKRLVAHASLSQMGFCLFGMASLTPAGIQGSVMQMFSHGLVAAMLFVLVGILHDRVETRELSRFGGLAKEIPVFSAIAGFAFLASVGVPGISSFIGELMTLAGAFPVHVELGLLAIAGIIITAAYHLHAYQRLFFGDFRSEWRQSRHLEPFGGKFPEMRLRELATVLPLVASSLALGFFPRPLLALMDQSALDLADSLRPLGPMQITLFDVASRALALFC